MLWFLFCALLALVPVIFMAGFFWTIRRAERLDSEFESTRNLLAMPVEMERPAELRASSAALEAQFLVAPRTAVREAEALLATRGTSCMRVEAQQIESPAALRATFEELMRRIEQVEEAHR